jgi:hypothetical protein
MNFVTSIADYLKKLSIPVFSSGLPGVFEWRVLKSEIYAASHQSRQLAAP